MAASATKELSDITKVMSELESARRLGHRPSEASIALPGTSSAGQSSIFDVFRSLPPVDLLQEYGLNHNDSSLFPNPLREQICIVNSDTRKWSPQDHKNLSSLDILHWGYINHYLYGISKHDVFADELLTTGDSKDAWLHIQARPGS